MARLAGRSNGSITHTAHHWSYSAANCLLIEALLHYLRLKLFRRFSWLGASYFCAFTVIYEESSSSTGEILRPIAALDTLMPPASLATAAFRGSEYTQPGMPLNKISSRDSTEYLMAALRVEPRFCMLSRSNKNTPHEILREAV